MENSVGIFRTDRLMQGDRPSRVTVNTGSAVVDLVGINFSNFAITCSIYSKMCSEFNISVHNF